MASARINGAPKEWPSAMSNRWDRFEEKVEERILSEDHVFWDKVYRATKVVFSGFLLLLVLGSAMVSKSCLLILTWNIFTPHNVTTGLKAFGGHLSYIRNSTNALLEADDKETNIYYIWALFLVVVTPYFCTFVFSVWRLLFKTSTGMKWCPLFVAITLASLHSVGLSIFVFVLLPSMDPLSGVWYCSNITLVPSILNIISSDKKTDGSSKKVNWSFVGKIFASVFSVASMVCWCMYVASDTSISAAKVALFVLSPILVSLDWWENFLPGMSQVDSREEPNPGNNDKKVENGHANTEPDEDHARSTENSNRSEAFWNFLVHDLRFQNSDGKYKVYAIVNLSKIIITFLMVVTLYGSSCQSGAMNCTDVLFGIHEHPAKIDSDAFGNTWLTISDTCERAVPFLVAVVCILASFICHRLSVAAIKSVAQLQSFSVPITLTTPVTFVALLILFTQLNDGTHICTLPVPWWQSGGSLPSLSLLIVASVCGYLSLLLLTFHIWTNETERMKKKACMYYRTIFVKPLYCGTLLDQSLLLNRGKETKITDKANKIHPADLEDGGETKKQRDPVPKIYMCATMWHETEEEMTQILKSLFRMDIDQCARTLYAGGAHHTDFYRFEGEFN